ncbi:MAG TPA: hypothetical protein VJT74_16095 [Pyrinomonadaceae bacterium]|nr:hypothetical protein [Pyrinomonadaceae bacterium]
MMNEKQLSLIHHSSFIIPHCFSLATRTCFAVQTRRVRGKNSLPALKSATPFALALETVRAATLPVPLKPIIASRRFFNFCSRRAGKRQPLCPPPWGSCPFRGRDGVPSTLDL